MMVKKSEKKWTREGGRLKRMEKWIFQLSKDNEIFILESDSTNAIEQLIIQQIPKKPKFRKFSQKTELLALPLEIFLNFSVYLDIKDIENLRMVCKDLANLVNKTFIPRVVLPLSQKSLNHLGGRFILGLFSNVNIRLWGEGGFETLLKTRMNLKYLKEVKFVGNNYSLVYRGGLISGYLSIMKNIFLSKKYVRKLDISIDSSEECYEQLQRLKKMTFLEELCLRSSDFRSQYNRTMPEGRGLNQLLLDTLTGLNIKTLELKGFRTPWESYTDTFGIEIVSDTIKVLKLHYSKTFELSAIKAVNLEEIEISSDFWTRGQAPASLAEILTIGCPNLVKYNCRDLRTIDRGGNWLEQLNNVIKSSSIIDETL